jgi:integrase
VTTPRRYYEMRPDRQKLRAEALHLCQELGWTQKETAKQLNVPQPTVNFWLHQGDHKEPTGLDNVLQNCLENSPSPQARSGPRGKYYRDATMIKYLTQEELTRFFNAIAEDTGAHERFKTPSVVDKIAGQKKRNLAIFLIGYHHALRVTEAARLRIDDVDFTRGRIRIRREKGSLGGEYPMQPEDIKAVKAWLLERRSDSPYLFPSYRHNPIGRQTLNWWMKYYGEKAGIPPDKRHFHVLKHSICTHLLDAGAGIEFVQRWAGHKDINNTLIYAQLRDSTRDREAEKLFASPMIAQVSHGTEMPLP